MDVIERFDLVCNGYRYAAELSECHVALSLDGVLQLGASIVPGEDDDGPLSLVVQPAVWDGERRVEVTPDPGLVEYLAAAVRERAAAWGPPSLWTSHDWREVFKYAASDCYAAGDAGTRIEGGFAIRDVARVVASDQGENDGANWVAVCELRDGRFGYVEAGCDYTGWG